MIVGYSKLGRSWNLDPAKASTVGGDMDCIRLLMRLAWDNPQHTFLLVGRNSGEDPQTLGYPHNVVNPWVDRWYHPGAQWKEIKAKGKPFVDQWLDDWREVSADVELDRHVMWLGQHGTSNSCIPNIGHDWGDGEFTTPQASMLNYCGYLLDVVRRTGVAPILLCPDPRNYVKSRELITGPEGRIIAQYEQVRPLKCEQFDTWAHPHVPANNDHPGERENSVWVINTEYFYAALELTALDEPGSIIFAEEPGEHTLGVISNENRRYVGKKARLDLLKEWVLDRYPDVPLYGKWHKDSEEEIGRKVESIPVEQMYQQLRTFRSTITFPASGSGWATAKPWEAFAAGTVMFFHPWYDDQGHIMPIEGRPHWTDHAGLIPREDLQKLSDFLRVSTPEEFFERVEAIENDDDLWRKITELQRSYFECAFMYWGGGARPVAEAINGYEVE